MKNILRTVIVLFAAYFLGSGINALAQYMGVGYSPYDAGMMQKKLENEKLKDPFIKGIAYKFDMNANDLYRLQERGYGRLELIRILLIARKADIPYGKLLEPRDRSVTLQRIAKKNNIDYKSIYEESYGIKSELERLTTSQIEALIETSTRTLTGTVTEPGVVTSTETIKK